MRLGGRLHLAPVKNSAHVLDIGTGTGIWALQFAAENPQSDVIGTDISMIQPTENLPPNCSFVREDSEEEWIFGKKFTYIHWRLMVSAFQDHRAMLQKVYENLLPDGWAEFHEWSCEFIGENAAAEEELRASALGQLAPRLLAGGASTGRDFQSPRNYKRWMLELGFVDVTEVQILTPVNGWPIDPHDRMMGSWACLDLLKLVRATTKILHAGGIPLEEIPYFQDQVCQCLTQRSMRVYSPCKSSCGELARLRVTADKSTIATAYIVYGRKPSPQHSSSASLLQEPLNN